MYTKAWQLIALIDEQDPRMKKKKTCENKENWNFQHIYAFFSIGSHSNYHIWSCELI